MKKILKNIVFFMVVSSLSFVYALNANNGQNVTLYDNDGLKLGAGLQVALMEGKSREYVYDSYIKASELVWELDDVLMVGGVLSAELNNKIYFNLGMWKDIDSSDGTMEDSDWMDPYNHVETHYSISRTELKKADNFDVNVAYSFWKYNGETVTSMSPSKSINSSLNFKGILGYKYNEYKWVASGGYYLYGMNSPYYDLYMGQLPDEPGITYSHDMSVPYFGFSFDFNNENFGINGYCLYSKWADVDDKDIHHLRSLLFKESFDGAVYQALGLNMKWDVTEIITLSVSYEWEEVKKEYGNMEVYYEGSAYFYPYSAAFSHKNETAAFSVSIKFM